MNSGHNIAPDFNPTTPLCFDDAGRPVLVTHPLVHDVLPDDHHDTRKEFEEKLAMFLAWLVKDGNVITAGRKAMFLAHAAGKTRFKTDADLAVALNITPGRMSQIRKEIGVVFPALAACNRRQIKPRRIGKSYEREEKHFGSD